jgi:hypothetical protein
MHPVPRYFQWVRNGAYVFLRIELKLGDKTEEAIACPAFLVRYAAEDLVNQFLNVFLLQLHESLIIHSSNITPIILCMRLFYQLSLVKARALALLPISPEQRLADHVSDPTAG